MLIWYCLKGQMKLHGGPEFDTHDVEVEPFMSRERGTC